MDFNGWLQVGLYVGVLLGLAWPLGWFVARVLSGPAPLGLEAALGPVERLIHRLAGVRADIEQRWTQYALAMLLFNLLGMLTVYVIQRLQGWLPLNPAGFGAVEPGLAFNTAVSFASNTNWQSYAGEQSLSLLTQMTALGVQNFVSAATGIACAAALIRGLARTSATTIGNFWVDLIRVTLYILLPLSLPLALVLVSQGVVQTLSASRTVALLQPVTYSAALTDGLGVAATLEQGDPRADPGTGTDTRTDTGTRADTDTRTVAEVTLPMGPAASQVAIKQIGSNGGGFFGVNSAHPFENPTPLSNFLSLLAILLLPAAMCFAFGEMVGDRRQGRAVLAAKLVLFVPLCLGTIWAERTATPALAGSGWSPPAGQDAPVGADMAPGPGLIPHATPLADGVAPADGIAVAAAPGAAAAPGLAAAPGAVASPVVAAAPGVDLSAGNLEGKEVRFGATNSAIWAAATTAAANGSVNSKHDSFTPLGGMIPMWLMLTGEVVFGGVGSGLYGMLVFAMLAVFVAGLMVGRTPEYLGKKIEAHEIKMASLVILIPTGLVLVAAAIASASPAGAGQISNPGPHGFSQILYWAASVGNNNGSAFAGLGTNTDLYNIIGGVVMLIARYGTVIPVLAIAGAQAAKRKAPASIGTLPTHSPLFVALLVGVVVLGGALTFVPALALGPVIEHLRLR